MYLNAMSLPHRHPWFAKPTKRKRNEPDSARPDDEPRAKRRRSLEHGFANMSLEPPPSQPRPATPPIREITMKLSTWYEPEPDRIVITDLENYSDDEADASDAPFIPPMILKALTTRPLIPPSPSPNSQALVLFRPLASQIKPDDDAMDVEP
ncbi:hypothetical protein FB45DRAFT_1051944 [Roridomyces roridus]|uniref:Uncharacterized protein n=1 Tax=Roridomyces roridus TaxID=1738132 RepID=A0AAD7CFG2_9AGAR|nr:hypothetical protein FB45DRAFT_1051944 [Roridomyces roridus]